MILEVSSSIVAEEEGGGRTEGGQKAGEAPSMVSAYHKKKASLKLSEDKK